MAQNVAKDPLVLDFLGLTTEAEEMAIEEAMTQRMSQTLAAFELAGIGVLLKTSIFPKLG